MRVLGEKFHVGNELVRSDGRIDENLASIILELG